MSISRANHVALPLIHLDYDGPAEPRGPSRIPRIVDQSFCFEAHKRETSRTSIGATRHQLNFSSPVLGAQPFLQPFAGEKPPSSRKVEAIKIHHLVPRRHKV